MAAVDAVSHPGLGKPMLRLEGITKSYPGVKALSDVTFEVMPGEVHALLGENGAGKSTLMKILMGVVQADQGRTLLDGQPVEIRSPIRAEALGLAAVYQDVTLAQPLTVGENFFLGHLPRKNGMIDWGHVRRETDRFLRSLAIMTDVRTRVADLPIAQQQLIAIAKVIWSGARLIIFDEPTALLTNAETVKQSAINGIIALGVTSVIITGGIDLSVAAVAGLTGVITAMTMVAGANTFLACGLGLVAAGLVGVVNAVMIFEGGIPPFIATLATMTMGRGLINLITNAEMITGLPQGFLNFGGASYFGVPSQFWVWIGLGVVLEFVLTRTRLGRNFYAIGASQEVARLSGIDLRETIYSVYVIGAVLAGVGDWC